MQHNIIFEECEHMGDAENYTDELRACNARIIDQAFYSEEEVLKVSFEVADKKEFLEKFKETDAYQFSDWCLL